MRPDLALLALLGMTLAGCVRSDRVSTSAPTLQSRPAFGIEVIVRTAENFRNAADVGAFVDAAASSGVAAINLLVKQDEDAAVQSGQVYYSSNIAPRAPGYASFDVLQAVLEAARRRNIKVRAWVPQFHDQVAAKDHPAWQMMAVTNGLVAPYAGARQREYFVNPLNPDAQAYELSILAELAKNYPVDGFMLDWIRFDNFNMDMSDYTRQLYQTLHNIDPLTIDFSVASAAREQWNSFRTGAIAAYAHAVRLQLPAERSLGIYILPPEFVEVGQDAAKFNRDLNSLAPMCYFGDWGFPIEWLWSGCLNTTALKAGTAQIVPAMGSQLIDAQYQQIFAHLRTDFPQIRTIAWFHHGTWTAPMFERIARLSHL